jgi:hypothetical protein
MICMRDGIGVLEHRIVLHGTLSTCIFQINFLATQIRGNADGAFEFAAARRLGALMPKYSLDGVKRAECLRSSRAPRRIQRGKKTAAEVL